MGLEIAGDLAAPKPEQQGPSSMARMVAGARYGNSVYVAEQTANSYPTIHPTN